MDTPQMDTTLSGGEDFSILGQLLATQMLAQALKRGKLPRAFLFLGVAGTGKRMAAERLAHTILGGHISRIEQRVHPDLVWIEPTVLVRKELVPYSQVAEKGDVNPNKATVRMEQIRAVQTRTQLQPLEANRTVVVIEADRLRENSANALLKAIEEDGPTFFILISAQRPLDTLVSRCQVIPFRPLPLTEHHRLLQAECPGANHPLLVKLTQGRPRETIKAYRALLPLCEMLKPLLDAASTANLLEVTSQISALPLSTQVWLLKIAQWQYADRPEVLEQVETALQALQSYVSPLLVWDVFLGYGAIPILPDLQAGAALPTVGRAQWDGWDEPGEEAAAGTGVEQLSLAIAPTSPPPVAPSPEPQLARKKSKGKSAATKAGERVIPLFG